MDDLEAVQRGAPSHYPMGKKKKRGGRKKAPKAASPPVPTPGQPVDTDAGPQTAGLPTPVPDNDLSSVTSSCEADRSESPSADSHGTSPSEAFSLEFKRSITGQKADLAESSGEIAEKEAEHFPAIVSDKTEKDQQPDGGASAPRQPHKRASDGTVSPADVGLKKRRKTGPGAGRETAYPVLVDIASIDEQAARERARALAYGAGGVRFAPWNIPWRRRLQTLAVVMHVLTIVVFPAFFFFLCAIPLTWPIVIPYLLHMLLSKSATDGRLRMRSERWRRLRVWKFFAGYFPAQLHKTHELPPTRKYIFGYHPHGIISHGAFAAFGTEALGFSDLFPGITNTLLTLDANFRVPLYRDYLLAAGLSSVSKESITNTLTKGGRNGEGMGRAVTIVIGGARESLEARPGIVHLVLAERKGFVKMALRTGADLVPVLAFGENDLYDQVSPKRHSKLHRLQMGLLRTVKFTLPFLHGRGIFNYDVGMMPYRRPLNIVVGRPIMVAQARNGEIDSAEVDRLHKEYVDELRLMWELYKDVFAPGRKEEDMLILK